MKLFLYLFVLFKRIALYKPCQTHTHTQITVGGSSDESQWELISYISDLYKELNGYRPKFDRGNSSTDEIQDYYNSLVQQSNDEEVSFLEGFQLEENQRENAISKALSCGAEDEATALRWLEQAEVCF